MKYFFSWYIRIPVLFIFSLIQGIFLHPVSIKALILVPVMIFAAGIMISAIYENISRGVEITLIRRAKNAGFLISLFLICMLIREYVQVEADPTMVHIGLHNLRYVLLNLIVAISYNAMRLLWGTFTGKSVGLFLQARTTT